MWVYGLFARKVERLLLFLGECESFEKNVRPLCVIRFCVSISQYKLQLHPKRTKDRKEELKTTVIF